VTVATSDCSISVKTASEDISTTKGGRDGTPAIPLRGDVLSEAAVHAVDRIAAVALVAPAGFDTPLPSALARIVGLSLACRVVLQRGLVTRALAPIFSDSTNSVDDIVIETAGQALRTGHLQAAFPGPDDLAALAEFDAPAPEVLADRDRFLPAGRIRPRVKRTLPSLVGCIILAGEITSSRLLGRVV
jgi:hypothetical protein